MFGGLYMKKKLKPFCLLLSFVILVTMCNFGSHAAEESNSKYEEYHDQINYKHSELKLVDNEVQAVYNQDNFIEKYLGGKECEKTNELLDKYDGISEKIADILEIDEEICAVAYTEAPIAIYEDHTERIEKEKTPSLLTIVLSGAFPIASAATTAEGDKAYKARGNFVIVTIVSKQNNGTYNTSTMATWEKGSFVGGEDYPASGDDYVIQSVPASFSRLSHDFYCLYNKSSDSELVNSYDGVEGKEYSVSNGGNTYVRIDVKDDPLGTARLAMAILTVNSASEPYSGYRTINSYYVHTWKSMTIDITIGVNTKKEATLTISPSIAEKSWQVYSYVTFNF